ncbi:chemotaxis protein CheW [Paracoccus sp. (in: a-proteobacteria)]|uniref:chemotaxis protein CheW n=1 Tax=Paracoccus sp. TaxID=267 RepID=UPI00396C5401
MDTAIASFTVPGTSRGRDMVLIFRLLGEAFALSVSCVHEILDPIPVTDVPNAQSFAPALVNVRGAIVPLIDIRHRLDMPTARAGASSRMIVLELPVAGVPTRLAILCDAVEEVIEADTAALESIPNLGARWPDAYVQGVVRHGEDLVILLEAETLFRPEPDRPAQG